MIRPSRTGLFALLTLLLSPAGPAGAQVQTSAPLTIRFLDVGQGDAVLITAPTGQALLYDGGRSESRMRELIRQYDPKQVNAVIASHGDADHITGLIPAIALFKPQYFINNGLAATTQTWERLVNMVKLAGTTSVKAAGQVIKLGDATITVLSPPPGMPDDQNLNSIGLKVEYAGFTALMTGDSEPQETNGWLRQYGGASLGPIDVYKSIHHGSSNGDTRSWLAAVRPQNIVVSVRPNNYGHPTQAALDLYKATGATLWRTDLQGTVTVSVKADGTYQIGAEFGVTGPWRSPARSGPAAPTQPAPPSVPTPPAPPAAPPAPPSEVYYPNCAAVRAAGAAPLYRGQPGYRPGLDGDADGVACEK